MPRIALGLEYDGSGFAGWQSQEHARGIQAVVEQGLSLVADHKVEAVAAGRTDAGVHAAMQVVHFDTTAMRTERSWMLGAVSNMPKEVSVLWAREVPEGFHARYSALARRYRYVILNRTPRPALNAERVAWIREPLDENRMHEAAQHLVGEHDFSSFRAAQCQSRTPMRNLHEISVTRHGELVVLTVCANAFLHHMVRNIAGVLIAIGSGERPVDWSAQVLAHRDRKLGGVTAAPGGLYLAGIRYAPALNLPSEPEFTVLAPIPATCRPVRDQV
ncbi:tRNA pseudouridine(38-40) synthase TruA [Steroidobacter sp. S1-65]|uniref:tRNA pseudouridine synthase A n=1 Tax=Steroidobacter gossypii TaxID=2805490 RepID=A0ABS1X1G7_9GAMM|nr:tRNA pseudouridine(38-40) synthase TruA [Steroidobacter gossypii]MBM0107007.1 tRNA pseudouridine(38-40) synthase TruA [Steroidobacter gossypii]